MFKLKVAIKKELLMLLSDRAGLAIMFLMPLLLVYIVTIVQDSAFKIVNENKISLLIVNADRGKESQQLVKLLEASKFFSIRRNDSLAVNQVAKRLHEQKILTALYLPQGFSAALQGKATKLTGAMMEELGLGEGNKQEAIAKIPNPKFYHDPVLQENYCSSIINMVDAFIKTVEGELLISTMCNDLGLEKAPNQLREAMINNRVEVDKIAATLSENKILPNSTQHNVPAWTIFAMFFMVISLGGNIVKERLNGSFVRLRTMPTSFALVLGAKLLVYLLAAVLQVTVVFSLAALTFPSIGLPALTMPSNGLAFVVVVLMSGLAAVSYATIVGTMASTTEQANGFGAVSIVILAALGGIWVPSFVLPETLQTISYLSPLYWCLEGFYTLFLRGGDWLVLMPTLLGLAVFVAFCWAMTYWKMKKDRII